MRRALQGDCGGQQGDCGTDQLGAVQHQRRWPLVHPLVEDVGEHEGDDPRQREQHVLQSRGLRAGPCVHGEDDAGEAQQQTDQLPRRQRLAQQPGREQRQDQRVGAGDDRPHARREVPQRQIREPEVERVRAEPEREEPGPGPKVARDRQPHCRREGEEDASCDRKANRQNPERRRVPGEHPAGHERRCPEEHVEDRRARTKGATGRDGPIPFWSGCFGHAGYAMPSPA